MNKKNLLILLSILTIVSILAVQLTTFTNSLTEEELTFSGNETIERNFSIYRYADVNSAFMNLSGIGVPGGLDLKYTGEYYEMNEVTNLYGIAHNGTYFWAVDSSADKVYKYYMNGTYAGENFSTIDPDTSGCYDPSGIETDGSYIYVLDRAGVKICKYDMAGTYYNEYSIGASGCTNPTSLTIVGTRTWVSCNSTVYEYYTGGSTATGDSFSTAPHKYYGLTNDGDYFFGSVGSDPREGIYHHYINGTYIDKFFSTTTSGITAPYDLMENGTNFWVADIATDKVYIYSRVDQITNPSIKINDTNIWSLFKSELQGNTAILDKFNDSSNSSFLSNDVYLKLLNYANITVARFDIIPKKQLYSDTYNDSQLESILYEDNQLFNYSGNLSIIIGDKEQYLQTKYDYVAPTGCGYCIAVCSGIINYIKINGEYLCGSSSSCGGELGQGYCINGNFSLNESFINEGINEVEIYQTFGCCGSSNYHLDQITINDKNLSTDYPQNPSININGTEIWNHSEEFNLSFSANSTDDFSDVLNSYLSSCEADNESYCQVPISIIPNTSIVLLNNLNIEYVNISKTLDFKSQLDTILNNNCTDGIINGTKCIINFLFNSDTAGILKYFNVDINYTQTPNSQQIEPTTGSTSSSTNTLVCNLTTDEGTELTNVTLKLWNSTGSLVNSTTRNISGQESQESFNVSFGYSDTYFWNCEVYNNISLSDSGDSNFTLYVDTVAPAINLAFPTNGYSTTVQSTTFIYTSQHSTEDIDTCSLYTNEGGVWSVRASDNSTTEVGINSFLRTMGIGSYIWNIWCNTTTGSEGFALNNYTLTITEPAGGGGGGGGTTIIGVANWTMETAPGIFTYDKAPPVGTQLDLTIDFENIGEENIAVSLSCVDLVKDMCQYVSFVEESFGLPLIKNELLIKTFTITIPDDIEKGEYKFNIIGTDQEGRTNFITTTITTGGESVFLETLSKITLKSKSGIPIFPIFAFVFILSLILTTKLIKKEGATKFLLVMGISGFASLLVVYLI